MIRINAEDNDASPDAVREIIESTTPVSVRIDEVTAGPVRHSSAEETQVELNRGTPAYAVADDGQTLLVRLEHSLRIATRSNDSDSDATSITVFHLAAFDCHRDLETSANALSAWIETNVYFMVYPYVRQFFTMMTADMGMPPVVLGYMRRTELPFARSDRADEAPVD